MLIAEFSTPVLTFRSYYVPETYSQKASRHWTELMLALFGIERGSECQTLEDFAMMYDGQRPSTVSYCLPDGSKYIQITNYNEPIASK